MFAMRYGANANARPATKPAASLPVSSRPSRNIAEPRQRERREEQQVVAEDRILRQRVDRQHLQRLRQEVLGVGERQRMRREDVGVPPAASEMRGVPRQHPRREQRIAEVAGHVTRQAGSERPGHDDRQHRINRNAKAAERAERSLRLAAGVPRDVADYSDRMHARLLTLSAALTVVVDGRIAGRPGADAIDWRDPRHARSRARISRDGDLARRHAASHGSRTSRPPTAPRRSTCARSARPATETHAASRRPTTAAATRKTASPGRPTATRSRFSPTPARPPASSSSTSSTSTASTPARRVTQRQGTARAAALVARRQAARRPLRRRLDAGAPARSSPTNPTPASSATSVEEQRIAIVDLAHGQRCAR